MSLTFWIVLALGLIILISSVIIVSGMVANQLRTVPPVKPLDPIEIVNLPVETRVGLKLHEACYQNDPQAAKDALVRWIWLSGEVDMRLRVGQELETMDHPAIQEAVMELMAHLDGPQGTPWFGDKLWRGFTAANPEFRELEIVGSG